MYMRAITYNIIHLPVEDKPIYTCATSLAHRPLPDFRLQPWRKSLCPQLPDKIWKFLTAQGMSWPITHYTNDGGHSFLVLRGTGCGYTALLPCVEEWCPWFYEVGVAEGEVPGCDDSVGSNGGLRRLLQNSEQQLQVLVTQRGATCRREVRMSTDHTHVCILRGE